MAVETRELSIVHPGGVRALSGVSVHVGRGELCAIVGPSGAGKSTLLRAIAGDVMPSTGYVRTLDLEPEALDRDALARLRRRIGRTDVPFVGTLSVRENAALPARIAGCPKAEALRLADDALDALGLGAMRDRAPDTLSTGERARLAVARTVVQRPEVVLADEPTAALDPLRAERTVEVLRALARGGAAVVVATHDVELARQTGTRTIALAGGRVVG